MQEDKNYHIDMDSETAKKALKDLFKDETLTAFINNLCFKRLTVKGGKQGAVEIKLTLSEIVPPDFFEMLSEKVKGDAGLQVVYSFEFADSLDRGELASAYWKFFAHTLNGAGLWLEKTTASYDGARLAVAAETPFVLEKLAELKASAAIKQNFRSFFGFAPEEITFTLASPGKGAEKEPAAPPPSTIRVTQTEEAEARTESKVLTDEEIKGESTPIENIIDRGNFIVEGRIFVTEDWKNRLKKNRGQAGKPGYRLSFYVTDEKDTLKLGAYVDEDDVLLEILPRIGYAKVSVHVDYDQFEEELTGKVRKMKQIPHEELQDTETEKRIELHAHTQMSAMDAVTDFEKYIDTAKRWGHKAVAITDHGVIHAFPEAFGYAEDAGIKLILGMEGYLVESGAGASREGEHTLEFKQQKPYHVIILVRNKTGLKNLYRLVSMSHIDYFYKKPKIPRAELLKYREGLILGTACYLGELYQAILHGKSAEEIERIAEFYDYFEIQPNDNNQFLIKQGTVPNEGALNEINRKICTLGEETGKPVVATGDVHFLKADDRTYREVLLYGQGYDDIDEGSADLSFKTTQQMLSKFAFLGPDKAKEVVVLNPGKINAMIEENLRPVPEEPHPPVFAEASDEVRRTAEEGARAFYGENPDPVIRARIEKELKAIIGNNFATLYHIARKMVKKSNSDGYIVGSRGSVGSSLVAFLTGVSEVNPLPAHYYCKNCKHTEFEKTDLVGTDLKPKKCPSCGTMMKGEGYNIPFETFMGFKGDKMPDIDLNFSGEYQDTIHDFVRGLFPEDKVYRAGTIVKMKELAVKKDYMPKYLEAIKRRLRKAEIERLAAGCAGIKRSTGQHAGGVMLVSDKDEIYDFTPIQFSPGRDAITTHFDFHQIHDTLVKVDALGHDLPTSLKRLCEWLKLNVDDLPLDDPETMKLFSGMAPLKVDSKNYEIPIGTLGIPEFGTKFTREMLLATKPKTFTELIYISGLSHGTMVWTDNAQVLIENKTATLKEVISVRDDIMNYLIEKGLTPSDAFAITEKVRKGKGVSPDHEKLMKKFKVPGWYISSCKKIQYMFPKAHAAAYTIMSFRIAYIKVRYPGYFYADFFTRELGGFNYEMLNYDMKSIQAEARELGHKRLDAKQKSRLKVLEVLYEMKDRGFEMSWPDLYASEPHIFSLKDGKILPPLVAVPEMGEKAAAKVAIERKKAPFKSLEDMKKRTGVNKNVIEFMKEHKMLNGLPDTDQAVLF